MYFKAKIKELKDKISSQLLPIIDKPYVLMGVPYYKNIGDVLIWEGSRQFLKSIRHKLLYQASVSRYSGKRIKTDAVILMQGGGNFGDLWRKHQDFLIHIIEKYPQNRIIVLPQSVHYQDEKGMFIDAGKMSKHKDLWLCARDNGSFAILKKHFTNNVLLVPDMAFAIDPESINKYRAPQSKSCLFLKRADKELDAGKNYDEIIADAGISFEEKDWPTYERAYETVKILSRLTRKKFIPECVSGFYADRIFRPFMVKKGVEFISAYNEIYTTRLHGAILSFLMGKKCKVFDNIYGKNGNFINTWLKDMKYMEIL